MTEVDIPARQAWLATMIRFGTIVGWLTWCAVLAGTCYVLWFEAWLEPLGVAGCVVLVLGVAYHLASRYPMALLLDRLEREIADPNRDSERREIAEMWFASQQPRVEYRTVREPVPVRVNGARTLPSVVPAAAPVPELSQNYRDLIAFAQRAAIIGLTRSAWLRANASRETLPSGTQVTRAEYDRMVNELLTWGFVQRTPAGYEWAIDSEDAYDRLVAAAEKAEDE
jgi:hypothetical protein